MTKFCGAGPLRDPHFFPCHVSLHSFMHIQKPNYVSIQGFPQITEKSAKVFQEVVSQIN